MTATPSQSEQAAFELQRLLQSLEALVSPACCRGVGTSVFQVVGRDGRSTGEEVRLCNGCGRELPMGPAG